MSMNMDAFDAKEQAESSGHKPAKKGGRKPKLTEDQKRENRKKSCKKYRLKKEDEYKRSEAENKSLKEKMEVLQSKMEVQQSEINSLNEELPETKARAYKIETELSVQSKSLNKVKMANEALKPGMQQLQQDILDKDVEDDLALDDIPMDPEWWNNLENLIDSNETTDSLLNEATRIGKTKLSPLREIVTVEGFRVPRENSPMLQEIFNNDPNIASGLQFRHQASRNCLMNILAEVYKMATIDVEKCSLEKIEHMEDGIKDLELAGLNVSWLKVLVAECRKEVEDKEEIKSMEAKVKLLEERQRKRREERELSKRQRVM